MGLAALPDHALPEQTFALASFTQRHQCYRGNRLSLAKLIRSAPKTMGRSCDEKDSGFHILARFRSPLESTAGRSTTEARKSSGFDTTIDAHARQMVDDGRRIFRSDTFGSEAFWGDALQLHKAIAGEKHGGVGGGVSPKTALSVGLKVDADALPSALKQQIKQGKVNLDDPATTLALLKLNAVVGVTGLFEKNGNLRSMGIQCSFCHSSVDDSFSPGIGKRLDGWANRDLNVGAIVSLAPNLKPFTDLLGVNVETVRKVLASWGPGCSMPNWTRTERLFVLMASGPAL